MLCVWMCFLMCVRMVCVWGCVGRGGGRRVADELFLLLSSTVDENDDGEAQKNGTEKTPTEA